MRQETIIKTYKYFNEFDAETQDMIIRKYDRINEYSWEFVSDDLIKDFTGELESMGYSDIKIQYTGFYSQGDGLSFTANHGNDRIYRTIHQYSHSNTVSCDNKELLEASRKLMKQFYKRLMNGYEYLYTKDAIIETLSCDYEFDVDTLKIV